jgi:outer membrane biosynthesis protein TonB
MEQSGANVSGQLLRLGNSSGSGSGIVPNYGGLGSNPSNYPSMASHQHGGHPPPSRSGALIIVVTVGCFILAGLAIVVLGIRKSGSSLTGGGAPVTATPIPVPMNPGDHAGDPPPPVGPEGTPPPPATAATPVTPPPPTNVAPPPPTTKPTHVAHTNPPVKPPPPTPTPKTTAAPTPPPQPPTAEEPGYLTVSSYPWAKVTSGGKVICAATPCSKVPMSPGPHNLTFENPEQGLKQSVGVVIKSGEVTTKSPAWK